MKNGKYNECKKILYYKDDKLHRESGPAIEWHYGGKVWCKEGKLHRVNGPAIDFGTIKMWFIEDKLISCSSQEEFERMINLINFW